MKRFRGIVSTAIITAMLLSASVPAFAFSENEGRSIDNFFIEAQLLKGDGSGYGLNNKTTRMEGIVILIRLLGKEDEAQAMKDLPCRFLDVPAWATGYANYAYSENISMGVSETRFGTNELMTAQQYNTLMLRTLGYSDAQGDFDWDDAVGKADELEILPLDLVEQYEYNNAYSKGDLIDTSFCYLEAQYKDENKTMIESLIEADVISEELAQEYGLAIEQWDELLTNIRADEYFKFRLKNDELSIAGESDDDDRTWIMVSITNVETGAEKSQKVGNADQEGQFDIAVSLANLPKGEYYVNLYSNDEKYHTYHSVVLSSVIIKIEGDDSYLRPSPVYGQNLRIHNGNLLEKRDRMMNLETKVSNESVAAVNSLAADITENCTTDYERLLAIHDWVSANVYYDDDFASDKVNTTNFYSADVIENGYAVCSGYAALTKDLLNAVGIPCKQVYGYALGVSEESVWEDVDLRKAEANHVWNEAYVDGRWIILDTTWDSMNKYEGGNFTRGDSISHLYFDVTLEFLSNTDMAII